MNENIPILTSGQKMVGLTFNPSNDDKVSQIKRHFADLIDEMISIRNFTLSGEKKRLTSIAITELQTAQMWAIKAQTWSEDILL